MELLIARVSTDDEIGTFGVLKWTADPAPFALSCEDPWLNNEPWVSCIPVGSYKCRRVQSPKFGDTFEVTNVEGRSHILFHKGNTHHNTNGCILVGESFDFLSGVPSVKSSAVGYGEFMKRLDGLDEFDLRITWSL